MSVFTRGPVDRNYRSPLDFRKVEFGPGRTSGRRVFGAIDFGVFTGGESLKDIPIGRRGFARATARGLGNIGRMSEPLSNTFSFAGRKMTYGRGLAAGGLGVLALRNAGNMIDRMRYGDYGGAMMSGALTAAAGYGAYTAAMTKTALRSHFNNAAAWLLKRFRA